ncbi:hypothetical protein [Beggiatoa leptomitoformis]|uniref:Uncharacterized protein n=1 Tax=Beggiatoa leptomitoformis TaxID=288004 RepID=A0A2N9YCR9_9GAMM|nr:hypothetical protein [Beggiatoa leptomitoformis]ALG66448.1 hypothetical protein AL038_00205 [Beggiatoa leptomitoformis]AUI68271.1 hypothetical protein BLE401_05870 [Beggiatoa leptomitoformis]
MFKGIAILTLIFSMVAMPAYAASYSDALQQCKNYGLNYLQPLCNGSSIEQNDVSYSTSSVGGVRVWQAVCYGVDAFACAVDNDLGDYILGGGGHSCWVYDYYKMHNQKWVYDCPPPSNSNDSDTDSGSAVPFNNQYCVANPTPTGTDTDKPYCACLHTSFSSNPDECSCMYDNRTCTSPDVSDVSNSTPATCQQLNVNGVISFCKGAGDCGYTTSSCTTKEDNTSDDACMAIINKDYDYNCMDTTDACSGTKQTTLEGQCEEVCKIAGRSFYHWRYWNETEWVDTCKKESQDDSIPDCPAGQHWETMGTQETSHCVDDGDVAQEVPDPPELPPDDVAEVADELPDAPCRSASECPSGEGYCGKDMKYCDWLTYKQGAEFIHLTETGNSTLSQLLTQTYVNGSASSAGLSGISQQMESVINKSSESVTLLTDMKQQNGKMLDSSEEISGVLSAIKDKLPEDYSPYFLEQRQHNASAIRTAQDSLAVSQDIKTINSQIKTSMDAQTAEYVRAKEQTLASMQKQLESQDLGNKQREAIGKDVKGLSTQLESIKEGLESGRLDIRDLKDYAEVTGNNTKATADNTKAVSDKMDNLKVSTDKVGTDTGKISTNTDKIGTDTGKISTGIDKVGTDTGKISTGIDKIGTDTGKISTNTDKIGTDTGKISTGVGQAVDALGKVVDATEKLVSLADGDCTRSYSSGGVFGVGSIGHSDGTATFWTGQPADGCAVFDIYLYRLIREQILPELTKQVDKLTSIDNKIKEPCGSIQSKCKVEDDELIKDLKALEKVVSAQADNVELILKESKDISETLGYVDVTLKDMQKMVKDSCLVSVIIECKVYDKRVHEELQSMHQTVKDYFKDRRECGFSDTAPCRVSNKDLEDYLHTTITPTLIQIRDNTAELRIITTKLSPIDDNIRILKECATGAGCKVSDEETHKKLAEIEEALDDLPSCSPLEPCYTMELIAPEIIDAIAVIDTEVRTLSTKLADTSGSILKDLDVIGKSPAGALSTGGSCAAVKITGITDITVGDPAIATVTIPFYSWTTSIMGALPIGMLDEGCTCTDPVWLTPHGENWGKGMCERFELFRTILSWVLAVYTCFTIWNLLMAELGRSINVVKG